jgi:hypothetical protein
MKRNQKIEAMRQALSVCLECNLLGPREVCLLLSTCKAFRNDMHDFQWNGYPHLVQLSLAQPSAAAWMLQHGQQLQQICFTDATDAQLRNIFTYIQRRSS